MKESVKQIPVVGNLARQVRRRIRERFFPGSEKYWEERYSTEGNSGKGSYDALAEFKAAIINKFVASHGVHYIIELGSGDGNQLRLADYPRYLGFDVSETAVHKCRELFKDDDSKSFRLMHEYSGEKTELGLSLDVIYHLVEDKAFETYMRTLFEASDRFVIIYSSNFDGNQERHLRHRKFTRWIERNLANWRLIETIPNIYPRSHFQQGSRSEFFVYEKAYPRCQT